MATNEDGAESGGAEGIVPGRYRIVLQRYDYRHDGEKCVEYAVQAFEGDGSAASQQPTFNRAAAAVERLVTMLGLMEDRLREKPAARVRDLPPAIPIEQWPDFDPADFDDTGVELPPDFPTAADVLKRLESPPPAPQRLADAAPKSSLAVESEAKNSTAPDGPVRDAPHDDGQRLAEIAAREADPRRGELTIFNLSHANSDRHWLLERIAAAESARRDAEDRLETMLAAVRDDLREWVEYLDGFRARRDTALAPPAAPATEEK
jgi:hypothetical protein